jgi:hypothetical protein
LSPAALARRNGVASRIDAKDCGELEGIVRDRGIDR